VAPRGRALSLPGVVARRCLHYFVRGIPTDGVWDIWRVRPSGVGLERLTTHNSYVAYPTLLDERTMVYLATSGDGSGPWLYTLDTERRVPHRISFGLETYTSLAARADGQRLVATIVNSGSSLWTLTLRAEGGAPATAPTPRSSPRSGAAHGWVPTTCSTSLAGANRGLGVDAGSTRKSGAARIVIAGAPTIAPTDATLPSPQGQGQDRCSISSTGMAHTENHRRFVPLRGNPAWGSRRTVDRPAVVRRREPR